MSNVIYRGPVSDQPQTINLPVAGAYLPGIMVTASASALTVATGADNAETLYVLGNADFAGQDLATAYVSGDTGVAYQINPNEIYQARLAAATYAKDAPLTIGADGYLTAAGTGKVVYARFDGTPGAFIAGELADVKIANSFVAA